MQTEGLMEGWLAKHEQVLDLLPRPSSGVLNAEASHALQTWDTELAKMRRAFATALERRNGLAPISALPVELLGRVFSDLVEIWPVNTINRNYYSDTSGWMIIVLVCRRWRNVAVDCASLWATVSLDGVEPINLFLGRAKACPLNIIGRVRMDNLYQISRAKLLLEHCDRLHKLDIHVGHDLGDIPNTNTVIFTRLAVRSPIKMLSVKNSVDIQSNHWNNHQYGPSHAFISTLASHLTTINLVGYLYPWGAGSPNLRSLTVVWGGPFPPENHSIDDILDSLRAMPALEYMALTGCLPITNRPAQPFIKEQTVSLPNMKYMQLTSHTVACWVLWALTDMRPSAKVTINSNTTDSNVRELVAMCLSRHMQRPSSFEYTEMSLWQADFLSLDVRLNMNIDSSDESADIELHIHIMSDQLNELALSILDAVPLERVETLSIRGACYTWSSDDLAVRFVNARRLRSLRLQGTAAARGFCSLLLPGTIQNEASARADPALPGLTNLHIDRVDMTTCIPLTTALSRREASRGRLSQLSIKRSTLRKEWVQTWKSLVDDVNWDGIEVGEHASEERELSERYGEDWAEDELDLLGGDAQSEGSFQWQDGLSEVEEDEEEDDLDQEDWE